MTHLFWFLVVFVVWIIMEIRRKGKVEHPYFQLMDKSSNPDIRDQDKGITKWIGAGTIILVIILIALFCWAYKLSNEPSYQDLQWFEMHHKRAMGLN